MKVQILLPAPNLLYAGMVELGDTLDSRSGSERSGDSNSSTRTILKGYNMKRFKFVYSFCEDEVPDAMYFQANNITNAKAMWESSKDVDEELLAIYEFRKSDGDKLVWEGRKTGFDLEAVR